MQPASNRSLEEKLALGLKYFKYNPSRVGSPQWDLFEANVLRPWSDQQLAKMPEADRAEVQKVLEKFKGGFLMKAEGL